MNKFFTSIGQQLYDIIGDKDNNTVGKFAQGFASGGIVSDESSTKLTDNDPLGVNSIIKQSGDAITKSFSNAATNYDKTFRDQMTMGHFIHNNFGNFFKATDSGGTNAAIKTPIASKATQATDPADFYAKWYEGMRRFAEASEVASRGQTTVRSR
jgi:hypothetical protein